MIRVNEFFFMTHNKCYLFKWPTGKKSSLFTERWDEIFFLSLERWDDLTDSIRCGVARPERPSRTTKMRALSGLSFSALRKRPAHIRGDAPLKKLRDAWEARRVGEIRSVPGDGESLFSTPHHLRGAAASASAGRPSRFAANEATNEDEQDGSDIGLPPYFSLGDLDYLLVTCGLLGNLDLLRAGRSFLFLKKKKLGEIIFSTRKQGCLNSQYTFVKVNSAKKNLIDTYVSKIYETWHICVFDMMKKYAHKVSTSNSTSPKKKI